MTRVRYFAQKCSLTDFCMMEARSLNQLVSNRNNSAKKCQIHINFLILLSFVKSKLMTKLKRSWKCSFLCKIFFPNINSFEKNIVIKRAQQFTKIVFSRFLQVKKVTAVGIFCNLRNFGATLCRQKTFLKSLTLILIESFLKVSQYQKIPYLCPNYLFHTYLNGQERVTTLPTY